MAFHHEKRPDHHKRPDMEQGLTVDNLMRVARQALDDDFKHGSESKAFTGTPGPSQQKTKSAPGLEPAAEAKTRKGELKSQAQQGARGHVPAKSGSGHSDIWSTPGQFFTHDEVYSSSSSETSSQSFASMSSVGIQTQKQGSARKNSSKKGKNVIVYRELQLEKLLIKVMRRYRHMPTMQMDIRHRRFLFVWHLLMLTMNTAILGTGVFLLKFTDRYLLDSVRFSKSALSYEKFVRLDHKPLISQFYGDILYEYGRAVFALGAIFMFVTLMYISFLGHRMPFTWPILIFIAILGLVFQMSNILVRLASIAQISTSQRAVVMEKLKAYQVNSDDPFCVAYDYISIWGKCCGISSIYDFQDIQIRFVEKKSEVDIIQNLQVPPTCCYESAFLNGSKSVISCAKNMKPAFEKGCFQTIYTRFPGVRSYYVIVNILWLVDIAIHIYIYKAMLNTLHQEAGIEKLNELEEQRKEEWDRRKSMLLEEWVRNN